MQKITGYDVVVIGSGGAGLRAGISSAERGEKTLILSKGKINRSGATLLAGANISADIACDGGSLFELGITDLNKEDTKEKWYEDLLHEGFYLNNGDLLKIFVETAKDRIKELMDWGMKVRGIEGERGITVFGSDILDTLYKRAKEVGAEFLPDVMFVDLIIAKGKVQGTICLDIYSGELFVIPAKVVILATGGAHNLFANNSGSTDLCGEGQAAALRARAELIDMEMISFCPTVTRFPTMYRGNILPYIFISTGYGRLVNKFGQTFTHRYLSPKVEQLALDSEWNKMLLSYAIQSEINAGGATKNGGVYFTLDLQPVNIIEELYQDLPSLRTGIYADIMKIFESGKAFHVQPAAHYFEGGIRIGTKMETKVPGLYAAGECTGGMFGANRVSAATTEMLVEGAIAGVSAAEYASKETESEIDETWLKNLEVDLNLPFRRKEGVTTSELIDQMQKTTAKSLMVIRNETNLQEALVERSEIEDAVKNKVWIGDQNKNCNRQWREYLALRNMVICAKAIVKSALVRKESRGVHIREDYLFTDNKKFLKNIVITNANLDTYLEQIKNDDRKRENGVFEYTSYIECVVEKLN